VKKYVTCEGSCIVGSQAYAAKGVRDMYPWQAAAIGCGEDGSNLVYCAPTSGGKSLVAEVLMLRKLLATRRPGAQHRKRLGRVMSESLSGVF
jgi:replicative superfamily II helicase